MMLPVCWTGRQRGASLSNDRCLLISLYGGPTSLHHVLRDAGLTDLEAELEQLAMNARRSPQEIFRAHPPDQCAQFRIDLRSDSKRAATPPPSSASAK
jgi:hypothetical protein